jgi:UDP-N-acetylmuramate dehydrogenase
MGIDAQRCGGHIAKGIAVARGPKRGERGGSVETELRGQLKHDESMARHVSWRAGGKASHLYQPADIADLRMFLITRPTDEPIYFVGLGSNLLVRDGGLKGAVILTHWAMRKLQLESSGTEVYAEAGLPSPKVARFAALHGLTGAEFLAGIPGTVGGALAMNAGCYGRETWDIVQRVCTIDRRGVLRMRTAADYHVSYREVRRKAALTDEGVEEWFLSATFRLVPGNGAASRERIRELLARRIATQPLGEPNAGSVFRNPRGDFAARLIEACGLKGHSVGGAVISTKHANFIVNRGGARAADIETLIERAQAAVREKFGIELEREVRIIGEPA